MFRSKSQNWSFNELNLLGKRVTKSAFRSKYVGIIHHVVCDNPSESQPGRSVMLVDTKSTIFQNVNRSSVLVVITLLLLPACCRCLFDEIRKKCKKRTKTETHSSNYGNHADSGKLILIMKEERKPHITN